MSDVLEFPKYRVVWQSKHRPETEEFYSFDEAVLFLKCTGGKLIEIESGQILLE